MQDDPAGELSRGGDHNELAPIAPIAPIAALHRAIEERVGGTALVVRCAPRFAAG